MTIRVFGIRDNSLPGTERVGDVTYGSHQFHLENLQPSLDLSGADLVMLPAVPSLGVNSAAQISATELLTRRILKTSQNGGKICLIYSDPPGSREFVTGRLLGRWQMSETLSPVSLQNIFAREFQAYLQEYGAPGIAFVRSPGTEVMLHPIAGPDEIAGPLSVFAASEGDGLIYLVPGNIVRGSELALLSALADSIAAHSATILRPTIAPIVDSFVFSEEASLHDAKKRKCAELEELDRGIAEYNAKKDILFLRSKALEERMPEWVEHYFGIATRRIEEYIEDFWLVDSEGNDAAICEVKALSQNVKREHIRALALHRDQRDLPDDFPSLLVVNTFADAETEEDKARQRVTPMECSNAVKEHVLVTRTLDLVRLLDQVERGCLPVQQVRDLLTTNVGWLKVEGDNREIVRN